MIYEDVDDALLVRGRERRRRRGEENGLRFGADMGTERLHPRKILPVEHLREKPLDRLTGGCRAKEHGCPLKKNMPVGRKRFPQSELSNNAMRVVLLIENMLFAKVGSLPSMFLCHSTIYGVWLIEILP